MLQVVSLFQVEQLDPAAAGEDETAGRLVAIAPVVVFLNHGLVCRYPPLDKAGHRIEANHLVGLGACMHPHQTINQEKIRRRVAVPGATCILPERLARVFRQRDQARTGRFIPWIPFVGIELAEKHGIASGDQRADVGRGKRGVFRLDFFSGWPRPATARRRYSNRVRQSTVDRPGRAARHGRPGRDA